MEADFSGYASKAGLKCSDGRTILPGAFKDQDQMQVPLVWQHGHGKPENVLGHAILENRDDGVYTYGFFNDTPPAAHARELVRNGDINSLSIWANDLIERSQRVMHGVIREVSLVLSGANPGAVIENVTIRHSDGDEITLEDEVVIYTGLPIEHTGVQDQETVLQHADEDEDDENDDDETIADVYNDMSEKQKNVLHYMVGEALEAAKDEAAKELKQSNLTYSNTEGTAMTHNVFEKGVDTKTSLSHDAIQGIVADATKGGSLKEAVENYALAHGITDIDVLFPEARTLSNTPEMFGRRMEWVSKLLGATKKSPFTRIKTISADLTFEEARAKGYVKGNLKREEFFGVSARVTTPTTIYKKQKLDRDDVLDITDFDVVAWLKAEMRVMLDEEIARAILLGDGRDIANADKINEQNIRPIASDHELYTTTITVNVDDANSSVQEIIDAIVANRFKYRGTGTPTLWTSEYWISRFLLLKDTLGRRIYKSLDDLKSELRVADIVPVEPMEEYPDLIGVIVNPVDYNVGADKGGNVSMFDDFDIDYNQHKYLIETRISGALTKLKSAIRIERTAGQNVLAHPTPPTFDPDSGELTITNTTGVVYKNGNGDTINAGGSPYTVAAGTTYSVYATPAAGYYFATSDDDEWHFSMPPA